MRLTLGFCLLFVLLGCGGGRFRAPCSIEPYAVAEFYNFTEYDKTAFVQQINDGHEHEIISDLVRPHTAHFYHLAPGYYLFGVVHQNGKTDAFNTTLSACKVVTVRMAPKEAGDDDPERVRIRPRRNPQP